VDDGVLFDDVDLGDLSVLGGDFDLGDVHFDVAVGVHAFGHTEFTLDAGLGLFVLVFFAHLPVSLLLNFQGLRKLGRMRVFGAGVNLQLQELLAAELGARQHAANGLANDFFGLLLEHLTQGPGLDSARVATVPPVDLGVHLVTGHPDLLGIDDDDEVARINVRGEVRLALSAQDIGELGGESAEGFALCVDDIPVSLAIGGSGYVCLHG